MFAQARIFQKIFTGIMVVFIGLMGVVLVYAYSRTSGATRQDMAEAQFIRQNAILKKKNLPQETIAESEAGKRQGS